MCKVAQSRFCGVSGVRRLTFTAPARNKDHTRPEDDISVPTLVGLALLLMMF